MSDPSTVLGASLAFAASLGRLGRRGPGWHLAGLRWSPTSGLSASSPALRWSDGPRAWMDLEPVRPAATAVQPGGERGTRAPVAAAPPRPEATPMVEPRLPAEAAPTPRAAPAAVSPIAERLPHRAPTPSEREAPSSSPGLADPGPVAAAGPSPPRSTGLPRALAQALDAIARPAAPQPARAVHPEPPLRERAPSEPARSSSTRGPAPAFEVPGPAPQPFAASLPASAPAEGAPRRARPEVARSASPSAPSPSVPSPLAPSPLAPSPRAVPAEAALPFQAHETVPRLPGPSSAEPMPFAASAPPPPAPAPAPSAGLSPADLPPLVRELVRKELGPRGGVQDTRPPAPPRDRAPAALDPDAVLDRADARERRDRFRAGRLP